MTQAQFVLHRAADIEAVFLGHHHVEKNQVRLFFSYRFERFFAIARSEEFYAFVLELFQGLLDQGAQVWFVVNNQDLHSGH